MSCEFTESWYEWDWDEEHNCFYVENRYYGVHKYNFVLFNSDGFVTGLPIKTAGLSPKMLIFSR